MMHSVNTGNTIWMFTQSISGHHIHMHSPQFSIANPPSGRQTQDSGSTGGPWSCEAATRPDWLPMQPSHLFI